MKRFFTLMAIVLSTATLAQGQIIISEIMYNPPESGNDTLEYIELFNGFDIPVNLNGYSFLSGVDHVFGDMMMPEGSYLVVSKDSSALMTVTGVTSIQWDAGALSNGGELIRLADADGNIIDSLDYADESPWPLFSDGTSGGGASIEFCLETDDNADGANWRASTNGLGVTINESEVKGTPGAANSIMCTELPAQTVIVTSNVFTPSDITINVGDKVLWDNQGGFHNVNGTLETYPDNPEGFGNGGAASAPWMYEFTFTKEGVYNYQCDPHVSLGMVGTVTVVNDVPNLVITEIMYNDPSVDELDSLEFIEVYNAGDQDVELEGITLTTSVINYTLPAGTLSAGEFLIIQKTESDFIGSLGLKTVTFENGGLSNNSDSVILRTAGGSVIDQVVYMDSGDWPVEADGQGSSISLCDVNSDNEDGNNWQASNTMSDREYEAGAFIFANPGALNICQLSIAEATATDENGLLINSGQKTILEGIVYGVNLRPGGLQFTIIDEDNEGIGVFSASENFGYEVAEGDAVRLTGEVSQFNGLAQIGLDTLSLLSTGNDLISADTVTMLNEDTESSLVTIKDVVLLDPSQWTGSGSGFNVAVSNGADTFDVRIDADVVDLYEGGYPTGVFNVTGIGGQFDNSDPFLSGYQLLPRYAADIEPYAPFVEAYPFTSIGDASEVDESGVAVLLDQQVEIIGVTHGINYRPNGLQFTIIDEDNDGIGLFSGGNDFDYTYTEGDMIRIKGTISQFNGLTQINPDSLILMSSGNVLQEPTVVSDLGEDTESQYVMIESATILDPTQWSGDGSSFNVDIQISSGALATLRIDSDSELSDKALPGNTVRILGYGGQFDNEAPFTEGYQILPGYESDVVMISNTKDVILDSGLVELFPNPTSGLLNISTHIDIQQLSVFNVLGERMMTVQNPQSTINISSFADGHYFMYLTSGEGIVVKEFIKQ